MNDEEIKAEMQKYTDALAKLKYEAYNEAWKKIEEESAGDNEKVNAIFHEIMHSYFGRAKEQCHNIAMECLNKILTSELKVFIKNLCLDRLHYPDDPAFYKMFGEYPKVGDKIKTEEAYALGFDDDMRDTLDHENSCYIWETWINGERWWEITDLHEPSEKEIIENRKQMKALSDAKRMISTNEKLSEENKEELFNLLNQINPSHSFKF